MHLCSLGLLLGVPGIIRFTSQTQAVRAWISLYYCFELAQISRQLSAPAALWTHDASVGALICTVDTVLKQLCNFDVIPCIIVSCQRARLNIASVITG